SEVEDLPRGDHSVDGTVVWFDGDPIEYVLGVEESEDPRAGPGRGERPVVVAAAPAEAVARPVHRDGGHQHEVRLGDPFRATALARGGEDPEPAGAKVVVVDVLRPPERSGRLRHRQRDPGAGRSECGGQGATACRVVVWDKVTDHCSRGDDGAERLPETPVQ